MKTIVAISLSFLIFFQSVGFGMADIFMLKNLVEHAQLHFEESGDDFFTFFEKHYGDLKTEHQNGHNGEKSPHEKLPFQHIDCQHLLAEAVVRGYEFSIKKSVISYAANPHFYYQDFYSFLDKTTIFQPPRIA